MASSLKNVGDFWQRTSLIQRVLLVAIVLACVGACVLLVGWARQPDMGMLYSGLSPSEASKIVDKVNEAGVKYELKDGGATIMVPQEKIYELRLSMAQQGLPGGDQAGYRIMDDEKIGASPFTQHVNFVRALEGELAKTIRLIDGVAFARVHIARPEKTVFASSDREASATVMLKVRPGTKLTSGNVAAITHMVVGAVEGLSADRVVVVDGQGDLLSNESDNEVARGAGSLLDQKARIEQYLSRKAEDMFAAVLGPGRANVQVDVAIDTSSRTQDKISPDAITKGVTHEVSKTSSVTSGTKGEGAAAPTNKEETTETNTNPGQVTEHLVDMPGTIKSKTVAAFVDLAGEKSADGKTAPTSITLKDAEDILRGAIGVGPTDTLKIVNTPFHHSEQEAQAAKADEGGFFNKDFILEIARRSSLGILVIGVLVMLKIFGGSKSKGGSAKVLAGATAGAQGALPAGAGDGDVDAEALRGRITAALQENPEEVKKLFLSWVESDRSEA